MFAIRLGPIDTGDGPVNLYLGFGEAGVTEPVMARLDLEGLTRLLDFSDGKGLRCERSLARVGRALGYVASAPPREILAARAALAFGLAVNVPPMDPVVVAELLDASARFLKAAPWRWRTDSEALDATIDADGRTRTYEASLMGAGGQEYGIALYDEPGSLARIVRAMESGRTPDVRRFSGFSVTFMDEPLWAAEAIRSLCRLAFVPAPIRLTPRGPVTVSDEREMLVLAAALRAFAALRRGSREGKGEAGEGSVKAEVRA